MAWTRDPAASIRDNIIDFIVDAFAAKTGGADGYATTWNAVRRDELTDEDKRLGAAVAVLEAEERKDPRVSNAVVAQLDLIVEFWVKPYLGESPSKAFNRALLDVQRTLAEADRCGGLAITLDEARNAPDSTRVGAESVSGVVFAAAQYRHRPGDPRKLPGE